MKRFAIFHDLSNEKIVTKIDSIKSICRQVTRYKGRDEVHTLIDLNNRQGYYVKESIDEVVKILNEKE